MDLLKLVPIGPVDELLHQVPGQGLTDAPAKMQVEQNGPEGEEFGEDNRVDEWFLGLKQDRASPFTQAAVAGTRDELLVFLVGDFGADAFGPKGGHANLPLVSQSRRG
jgi:hypothetical protein